MKKQATIAFVIVLLIAGGMLLVISKQKSLARLPKPSSQPPAIQTALTTQGTVEITSRQLGEIQPYVQAELAPRITGYILSITKREGDTVAQGEIVCVLDDRELSRKAESSHAEVLATRQRLAGARSLYETQRSVTERDEKLYKAGAISKEALERSRSTLESARSVVDAYEESIHGLERNVDAARLQAGYARIAAPFSGVVTRRSAEPGDLAVPGKAILTIQQPSPVKVVVQVPQELIGQVRQGTKLALSNGPGTMQAAVTKVYPALGKNLLGAVETILQKSPFGLPTGSTLGVDIVTATASGIIVPENALVRTEKGAFVYTINDGHRPYVQSRGARYRKGAGGRERRYCRRYAGGRRPGEQAPHPFRGDEGRHNGRQIMNIVRRYIEKPHLVLSFVILLSVVGIMGYKSMPFNLFPDTDRPQISVITFMPGAAAADVETDITRVIEKEVSSIDMVRTVTSTSKDEVSVVLAEFEYEKGLDSAATDVANALSKVTARLPQGIRPPQVFKISQATQPTMTLALSPQEGSAVDLRKIRELADNQIKEELLRIPDVGNVEVFGGHQPEISVLVEPDRLNRFGIGITDVMAAVSAQNQNIPQGIIIKKEGQYLFKTEGAATRMGQLADLVVARRDTGVVHLRDVAKIQQAEQEPQSAYHGNGKEAIGINILRTQSGHTLDPILAIEAYLPAAQGKISLHQFCDKLHTEAPHHAER